MISCVKRCARGSARSSRLCKCWCGGCLNLLDSFMLILLCSRNAEPTRADGDAISMTNVRSPEIKENNTARQCQAEAVPVGSAATGPVDYDYWASGQCSSNIAVHEA